MLSAALHSFHRSTRRRDEDRTGIVRELCNFSSEAAVGSYHKDDFTGIDNWGYPAVFSPNRTNVFPNFTVNGATDFFWRQRLKSVLFSVLLSNPIRKTFFADQQLRILPHVASLLFLDASDGYAPKRLLARQTFSQLAITARGNSVCWLLLFWA